MFRLRLLEIFLIIAILPLGLWAWRTGQERATLEARFARLDRAVGDLEVTDPSMVFVRASKTEKPLTFAWRVFLPAKEQMNMCSGKGMNTISGGFYEQMILRLSVRDKGSEGFEVYAGTTGATMWTNIGDGTLTDLLRDRPEKIIVEQTGVAELVADDPAKPIVLLRLRLADDIRDEAALKLSAKSKALGPTFYEFKLLPMGFTP